MAIAKLAGRTKMVGTRIRGSPQGAPPFHRIAEVHFPSREVLEACAASEGGKQTIAHAVSISSGGVPTILVAEEETLGIDNGNYHSLDSFAANACRRHGSCALPGWRFEVVPINLDFHL
jgi:hypothetical protein